MTRKTKPAANLSLFEAPLTPEEVQAEAIAAMEKPSPSPNACPRCGKIGLKSVRPMEYGGLTHYCAQCTGAEPGEPFRFTPGTRTLDSILGNGLSLLAGPSLPRKVETPAEQSQRLSGSNDGDVRPWIRPALEELPREIETEAIGEGEQQALLETGEKWEDEWDGMPEFVQEDLAPYKTIYVHFESREDMAKFAKLVKQTIGLNTRSIWYPEAEIGRLATKRYIDKPVVDKKTKEDKLRK